MATKTEIIRQIRRLERYGKLNEIEAEDYINYLKAYSIKRIETTFKYLSENYTGFGFPKIPDIKDAFTKTTPSNALNYGSTTGDKESTEMFLKILMLAMECANKADFCRIRDKLLVINGRYGDDFSGDRRKQSRADYSSLLAEVQALPKKNYSSRVLPKTIPGPFVHSARPIETPESEMVF